MKIALVSQEYPPHTAHGGIATQTLAKAVGLSGMGHEVFVITRSVDDERHVETHDRLRVWRLPGAKDWKYLATEPAQWLAWSVDVAAAVMELHGEVHLDVVDVPDYGVEGYVHLLNQTAWGRIPTVLHLHGPMSMLAHTLGWPPPDSALYVAGRHMERVCLDLADAVISSSACSVAWCAAQFGLDPARVPVVHTGVDTRTFRPAPAEPERPPTVVFAGRLAESKGVDALVAACSTLRCEVPELKLVLIGRGSESDVDRLEGLARAAGFPDLLDFRGHLSRDELARQLPHADVFAAPSVYEGGPGLVYLEAMACGLPVIACSGSGAAEVVEHGVTGLLVEPGDPYELVAALRSALAPGGQEMGRAGRRRAQEAHDTRMRLRALVEIYARVASGRRLDGTSQP